MILLNLLPHLQYYLNFQSDNDILIVFSIYIQIKFVYNIISK